MGDATIEWALIARTKLGAVAVLKSIGCVSLDRRRSAVQVLERSAQLALSLSVNCATKTVDVDAKDVLRQHNRVLMFPVSENSPSCGLQRLIVPRVSRTVELDLWAPVFGVGRRWPIVLGTSMPETPVDKDGDLGPRENYVRTTPQASDRRVVDSKSHPETVQ